MDNTRALIRDGLAELGIDATDEQVDALARHVAMVYETNEVLNLTSIDPTDAASLHVLDSCAALPYLLDAAPGSFADLGSGAGFPGVPLAILSGREVALVESVRKKAAFLESAVEALRLKATVHPIRAEELAQQLPRGFSVVTARALSSLPSLVELASPLLMAGGSLICLKGHPDEDEVRRGDLAARQCGMRRVTVVSVKVPGAEAARQLVVYRREGASRVRLPRRNGMAQRKPLA